MRSGLPIGLSILSRWSAKLALGCEKGRSARTQECPRDAPTVPPFSAHMPPPHQEMELIPLSLNFPSLEDWL